MPDIKCPNCNYEFPLEEALNDELKEFRELIEKWVWVIIQQPLFYSPSI